MKKLFFSKLKPIAKKMLFFGLDPRVILSLRYYPTYRKQRKEWISKGGKITKNYMILQDYAESAGSVKGQYFHQDLLVANMIFENNPKRHVDIGSRIDGFVAHVAAFREIEVVDIRPLQKSEHINVKFRQADLMEPQELEKTDSLSCLHTVEHFGLGRYTDKIDVDGHLKGIEKLVSLVNDGGRLYISFPIGMDDEVHFNAHRVFHPKSIFSVSSISKEMTLVRFDYVDDDGDLHLDASVEETVGKNKFGCGIYTFEKCADHRV